MAKIDFTSVDDYIARQPPAAQRILAEVRVSIRRAVPRAEEVISYQMPTYKLHGAPVLYFAGWKKHFSLYPASDRMVAAFGEDLAPCCINKGTIRFPLSEPVPTALIERIARFRAQEVAARGEANTAERRSEKAPTERTSARAN